MPCVKCIYTHTDEHSLLKTINLRMFIKLVLGLPLVLAGTGKSQKTILPSTRHCSLGRVAGYWGEEGQVKPVSVWLLGY